MYREGPNGLEVAVIRPRGRDVYALPKGHLDGTETAEVAAQREVREETGLEGALEGPIEVVRYMYRFKGTLISKQVSFFLFRAVGGEIDQLDPSMRVEVDRALWLPLDELPRTLTYRGEQVVARKARDILLARAVAAP